MSKRTVKLKSARSRNRGLALLIVLMLSVALTVVVWSFQRDVQREEGVQRNVTDDLRAELLAEMGLVRGQVVLRLDDHSDYDSLNEEWAEDLPWDGESFKLEDSVSEDAEGSGGTSGGAPQVLISDEDRKFNLLTLVAGYDTQKLRAKEVFTRLVEICRREDDRLVLDGETRSVRRAGDDSVSTNQLVDNLIKYLDERASEDSDELEFTLTKTSKADQRSMKKQTPFKMLTLGELLQVEGWTSSILYGAPKKAESSDEEDTDDEPAKYEDMTPEEKFEFKKNQVTGADERSRDPDPIGLFPFLTLYSSGRININTASRELILALDNRLTWDVVEQIITAREQDRRDVQENEDTGTIEDEEPASEDGAEEEEDKASYRPQDLANFQAFVTRTSSEDAQEGEQATVEGFTQEMYTAMRPWLTVRSTTYSVESSATAGKRTHTIRAVYRRTGTNQAPAQPAGAGAGAAPDPAEPAADDDGLPSEPEVQLTLLFRDIAIE